ncbi:hypothetical protein CTAM01_01333 [Colletotrichum tamarilloi]|uniref:Uncharacterized protein n=1 Tax=Colletotrichum tamarilloi TaxID=1209934 RepID=A0ABQ9RQU5_9PEZI|nr:uncharacterized protein CTAM01_01333 [Colletotrichum tamarilloi]KAK1510760.1 hypothetical protein CTAM01_01333 [Colletotrichum tamarilloi]
MIIENNSLAGMTYLPASKTPSIHPFIHSSIRPLLAQQAVRARPDTERFASQSKKKYELRLSIRHPTIG